MPIVKKFSAGSIRLMRLFLFLILIAMSGCATVSTAPAAVSDYCTIAKPIGYDSRIDSPETVRQIEAHNSKWACVCEGDCPKRD